MGHWLDMLPTWTKQPSASTEVSVVLITLITIARRRAPEASSWASGLESMQSDAQPHKTSRSTCAIIGEESVRRCHHTREKKIKKAADRSTGYTESWELRSGNTPCCSDCRTARASSFCSTLAPALLGPVIFHLHPPPVQCHGWSYFLWLSRSAPLLSASAPCPQLASEKRSPWAKDCMVFLTQNGAPLGPMLGLAHGHPDRLQFQAHVVSHCSRPKVASRNLPED